MDRSSIEIDLPARAHAYLAPHIEGWLSGNPEAGQRLHIPLIGRPDSLMHPAVTVRARESEIVLRLVDLQGVGNPMYLIEAADKPSRREIEALEERLTPHRPAPDVYDRIIEQAQSPFSAGFGSFWRV